MRHCIELRSGGRKRLRGVRGVHGSCCGATNGGCDGSLRSMEASGGAGHEDHVIPSRAKLQGRRDFQLGVWRPKPFRTLRSNVPRLHATVRCEECE